MSEMARGSDNLPGRTSLSNSSFQIAMGRVGTGMNTGAAIPFRVGTEEIHTEETGFHFLHP